MKDEKESRESTILKPFKLPPRAHVSKEEMLRNMRNIGEWRKKHLADLREELCAKLRAKDSR
jgi:hypothetical protein